MIQPLISPSQNNLPLQNLHLNPKNELQNQRPVSNSSDNQRDFLCTSQSTSNQKQHDSNELSFHQNSIISPRSSPKVSRVNRPGDRHKGSILHEVLASGTVERSQAQCLNSYLQKLNQASTSTVKSEPSTPPLHNTSTLPHNLIVPDATSPIIPASGFIPGSNHLMPAAGFALLNGMGFAPTAMNCMNPFVNGGILPPTMDPRMPLTPLACDKKQNKQVRPFKAITNELLYGIPAMALTPISPVTHNNGFKDCFQGPTKDPTTSAKSSPGPSKESPETSANSAINSSPCSNNGVDKPEVPGSGDSNCSYPEASNSVPETGEGSDTRNRKRTRTLPEELKDEAYWERRRKNNQAAKRSRDARRQKEDMVAQQAWLFREQNIQLRFQLTGLEEQHRCMQIQYRAMNEQCRNLELQIRLVGEKLARTRCEKCGCKVDIDLSEITNGDSSKKL